ncbi:anaerobic ribonucleoside-triphosphate reductase activating protein [Proteinivorax hydrogeniformans]|uniref:Anaerobic ribonucleoside-triphosphate reductase-activating protein n=1 Tax=Proteinivorax hydrogeniformans TaxID=1826727 RepID=A0AAU8HTY0_9FIRM
MKLKIAGVIPESVVDAPGGISYTIFAQGCKHRCNGCHNPQTHSFEGGKWFDIEEVLQDISDHPFTKIITFSGGDPFYQAKEFSLLCSKLKRKYKLVAYTGFLFEQLLADEDKKELLKHLDLLIDGPFVKELRNVDLDFRGSSNQRIIDVQKSIQANQVCLFKLAD